MIPVCPLSEIELPRRSYLRLKDQWQRIVRLREGDRKQADLQRWHHAAAQASEQFASRSNIKYAISYDPELPISAYRDRIAAVSRTISAGIDFDLSLRKSLFRSN